jgi:hypothetical protein
VISGKPWLNACSVIRLLPKHCSTKRPPKGNPSMDNLAAIFDAIRNWLKVTFDVRVVELA